MKPFVIGLGALALVASLAAGIRRRAAGTRCRAKRQTRPGAAFAGRASSRPRRFRDTDDAGAGPLQHSRQKPVGRPHRTRRHDRGPHRPAGAPGLRDGRIEDLLDKGAYKIRVANAEGPAARRRRRRALRRGRRHSSTLIVDRPKAANSRSAAMEPHARCRAGGPRRDRGRGARPR